jgi:hypothetical protein
LTVVAVGSGLQYSLNGGTYQTSNVFSNLAAGNYTVTIKDVNNCTVSSQSIAIVNAANNVNITSVTSQNACGSNNGSLTVVAEGTGLQYSLNGGVYQTNNTFSMLAAGNYIVTVKDVNNCTRSWQSVTIQMINIAIPTIQSSGNILTSSALTGNQWFLNGIAIIGATTPFYTLTSNAQNGSYTVRVTQNGCSATSQAISVAYAPPSIRTQTLAQTQYCAGATLKLPYSLNGNFNANATFNVELSNGTGSFVAPTLVSSFVTPPADSITCSLPMSLTTGNGYRLRITASNPVTVSDTTTLLTITNLTTPTIQVSGHVLASSSASGNQWFFNGQAIIGATNQFHTATQTGFYTVRVTQNGCQALSNLLNHIVSATHDLDNGGSVHVYPNPTDGQLWIQLKGVDKATIQVWNAIGQVVARQDTTQSLTSFNLNPLPNGVYHLHVIAANGKWVQKVVLQR